MDVKNASDDIWDVKSLVDFGRFVCPACSFKHADMEEFRRHIISNHQRAKQLWNERRFGYFERYFADKWSTDWEGVVDGESEIEDGDEPETVEWEATPKIVKQQPLPLPKVVKVIKVNAESATSIKVPRGCTKQVIQVKKSQDKDNPFACVHCDEKRPTIEGLVEHMKAAHKAVSESAQVLDAVELKCKYCSRTYETLKQLTRHQQLEEAKIRQKESGKAAKKWVCEHCGKVCSCSMSMSRHLFYAHERTTSDYMCEQCGTYLYNAQDLKRHAIKHSEARDYECDVCGVGFKTLRHMVKHRQMKHQDMNVRTCHYCGTVLTNLVELIRHCEKDHPFEEAPKPDNIHAFRCETCQNLYGSKCALGLHERKAHKKKLKICRRAY